MTIKVNITGIVVDWVNRPVLFQDQQMPLRAALISALTKVFEDDLAAPSETRFLRMELAKQVSMKDVVELTLDNVIFIARYLNRSLVHPAIYTTFLSAVEAGIERTPHAEASSSVVAVLDIPPVQDPEDAPVRHPV